MIDSDSRKIFEKYFCCCGVYETAGRGLIKDRIFHTFPTRVGEFILLCGKKGAPYPNSFIVGPDWPFLVLVYFLIIAIDAAVLYVVSPVGWPVILIGVVGATILLCAYSAVAFGDPGIVYRAVDDGNDNTQPVDQLLGRTSDDLEENSNSNAAEAFNTPAENPISLAKIKPTSSNTIECGSCNFQVLYFHYFSSPASP